VLTWLRWPIWTGLARGAFSLALAYAFMVILMTASAQQRVLANLGAGNRDYSSSLAQVQAAEGVEQDLADLRASERKLLDDAARRAEATTVARAAEAEVWQSFAPLVVRLSLPARCGPPPTPDNLAVWNYMQQCLRDGALDARLAGQLEAAAQAVPSVPTAYRDLQTALLNEQAADARLERVRGDIQRADAALAETRSLQAAFGEMRALRGSWLLGGGAFTALPPTLMQIVMAFFAGAFGALLITLVLAVYPQSSLTFTGGDSYYARILLGGLISVCVYIVMSGSSAILSDARPFDSGRMNVMTFCAVGLLAGMFSDRVALWFSERANVFFARALGDADAEVAPAARRPRAGG
jgi:hypothetical protein